MNIEPLESRIAPAAVFKFTDVDGDAVTIATSKGTNADLAAIVTVVDEGLGKEAWRIDFSLNATVFAGTNVTVTAKRTAAGGDGLANVGYIDASTDGGGTALDLGTITIRGDLGQIDAGDASTGTPAVKGLNVQSMGEFGVSTQQAGGSLSSNLNGALGSLKMVGSMRESYLAVGGGLDGKIGSITIGGSLIGGSDGDGGRIFSTGAIGSVKVGGDIAGGSSASSGQIGTNSSIASLTVGGSLLGGTGGNSGEISAVGAIGPVKIGGDIKGADADGGSIAYSGRILGQRLASLTVGGSIISGGESGGFSVFQSGVIQVADDIGAIIVKGSIIGNSANPVLITARGQAVQGTTSDVAIKSLTVTGRVEFADILAGYDFNLLAVNADAQTGAVVAGDWIASNLIAGVQDDATAARNDFFGEGDDQKIAGGSATIASKIASITIKGTARGTVGGTDHFGFVAQEIGSFKVGGAAFPLTPRTANDLNGLLVGATGDLRVREVAL